MNKNVLFPQLDPDAPPVGCGEKQCRSCYEVIPSGGIAAARECFADPQYHAEWVAVIQERRQ